MKRHNLLFLLLFAILAIFIWQCAEQPSKPEYDNPLDPENPATGGDPFALTASIGGGGIMLSWQAVTTVGRMEGYNIYRKIDADPYLLLMEISGNTVNSYIDSDIANGHSYSYYIVARDTEGQESTSNTAVVEVNSAPVLSIDDVSGYTPSRTVNLTLLAFGADKMQIGTPDLNSAGWIDYAVTSSIQLSTGAGIKTVQARFAYADGDTSGVIADTTLPMEMDASFNIENGAQYTETRLVNLYSGAAGTNLQAIYSEDSGFSGAVWQDYAGAYGFTLSTGAGIKTVYAKFKNDFEVESPVLQDSIETQPMNPTFNIAHNAQYTPTRQVWLFPVVSGANIQCKFAENSSFTGVNWQAYADSASFTLSTGAGVKTVYAKFRNDFEVESGAISDQITPQAMNASFSINNNANRTENQLVLLNINAQGANLKYLASEDYNFTGLDWQNYVGQIFFTLSSDSGNKIVFIKLKNDFDIESWTLADTINYQNCYSPTNLLASTFSLSQIELNWQDNSSVESGYKIERRDSSSLYFEDIDSTGPSITQYYDSGLESNAIYYYRVLAYNNNGNSSYSNIAYSTTTPDAGDLQVFPFGTTGLLIDMVWIPPGSFLQGCYPGELNSYSQEVPQHLVTLDYGFWLSKYEITQFQWEAIMGSWTFGFPNHPNYPAESVSWDDIKNTFLPALNGQPGDDPWRLPTESEWEYACRAETTTRYYWGDDLTLSEIGNYAVYFGSNQPAVVGSLLPNAWNLYDMSGNVWEWVEDYLHWDYNGAPADGSAWVLPITSTRVLRSGSWEDNYPACRSAFRHNEYPSFRYNKFGFRLVRNP